MTAVNCLRAHLGYFTALYGCRSPVIALSLVLVSPNPKPYPSCSFVSFAVGLYLWHSARCPACVARARPCFPAESGGVTMRADSACPQCGHRVHASAHLRLCACVLAVVGTGERAPLRFNTQHTHTHTHTWNPVFTLYLVELGPLSDFGDR